MEEGINARGASWPEAAVLAAVFCLGNNKSNLYGCTEPCPTATQLRPINYYNGLTLVTSSTNQSLLAVHVTRYSMLQHLYGGSNILSTCHGP